MVTVKRRAVVSHMFPCPPCSTVAATVPFDGTCHNRAVSRITNGDIRSANGDSGGETPIMMGAFLDVS